MQGKKLPIGLRVGLAIFTATLFVTSTWADIHDKVLHNFNNNGTDGASPQASLILDAAGNLYGTTNNGGTYNYGTVFELTPAGGGSYTQKVLHNFTNGADGGNPQSGLILDGAGNLYGTTYVGGALLLRNGVRVDARRGRNLEREGAVQLRQRQHGLSHQRPDLRWRRQSLRYNVAGRPCPSADCLRVDARRGRELDGEGLARLRQPQ